MSKIVVIDLNYYYRDLPDTQNNLFFAVSRHTFDCYKDFSVNFACLKNSHIFCCKINSNGVQDQD